MILVTGGAGFIGSHTCVELLDAGYEIAIIDNFCNSRPEVLDKIRTISGKDFKFYEADLLERDKVEQIFKENEIEEFQTKIHAIDSMAFIIFTEAQQIVGNGFHVYK